MVLLGAVIFIGSLIVIILTAGLGYSDPIGIAILTAAPIAVLLLGFFLGSFYRSKTGQERAVDESVSKLRKLLRAEHAQRQKLQAMLVESQEQMDRLKVRLEGPMTELGASGDQTDAGLAELDELKKRCESLEHHLALRKERIADLHVELSVTQADMDKTRAEIESLKLSAASSARQEMWDLKLDKGTVVEVLASLVALDGVETALIADDHGLVIESVGDERYTESMAAMSGLIASFTPHLKGIVPLNEITQVTLGDDRTLTLDTCFFELFEMQCALLIARDPGSLYPGLATEAIQRITEDLEK